MKKLLAISALIGFSASASAFNEADAIKLVKAYSKTVACQLEETKYKAVRVSGDPATTDFGDQYVVYWDGDMGCMGGNGTIVPNFTVVEIRGFNTPVVLHDYKTPTNELVRMTKFSGKDGKVLIEGVSYGPKDQQHNPTKKVAYTYKLEADGWVKQ